MDTPLTSVATSLGWQTHISRTSVGSLSCATFSDQQSRLVNGLEDVIRAVRSLNLPRFRYEDLIRKRDLGEGETYRVEECRLRNHVVAIKHLKVKSDSSEQAKFGSRLRAVVLEIQVMRHPPLEAHPNLPSVFGYGWKTLTNGILPFIVVEYAALGTFREYSHGLLAESRLRDIEVLLGDVVSGLSALHSCGIVHGDVKLDNVLIHPSRDNPAKATAKIADFGHAVVLNDAPISNSTGQLRYYGTTIYNAPEVQMQDRFPIERSDLFKCDIWSFGLLVWEACIEGQEYLQYINKSGPTASSDEGDCVSYKDLLELAKKSLPGPKSALGAAMFFRITLNKTLQEDPSRRASSARELPIYTRWNTGGLNGLSANLALHLETPLPTYEMFRLDNGKEISWAHQQQIFQGLQSTHAGKLAKEHNVITWQLAMAYYLGFGIAKNRTTAYHFAKLAYADNHPLALVFSDLFAHTPTLTGRYADCVAGLLRATTICSAWPPLVQACFNGDAPTVLDLLKKGGDPNTCTMDGCGLLHWLSMISTSNLLDLVIDALKLHPKRLFLNEAFTVTRSIHSQWPLQLLGSPLAIAISVNSEATVRALLSLGADPLALAYGVGCFPKSDPRSSWTAFHIAVKYHCIEILRIMFNWLSVGSKDRLRNMYPLGSALTYSTVIERVAMHGPLARVNLGLTINFIIQWQKIDAVQPDGMTSLMQAIDFEDQEVVSGLLQAEPGLAKAPFRSPLDKTVFNFPIHFAVQIAARRDTPDALEIPKLVNARSQDLDHSMAPSRDDLGRTSLHLAVTGESDRTARWILQNRIGLLEVEDKHGRTPLHYCTSKISCDLLLKENGANVNHTDKQGITSLHRACYLGNHELTKAILEFSPHLNLANNIFGTPLHCAVIRGSLECVLLLLEAGAPLEATDALGNTAMHVAARLDRHVILRLLLNRGAMRDTKNKFARDALSIALGAGRFGSKGVLSILRGQQHSTEMKSILLVRGTNEQGPSFSTVDPVGPRQKSNQESDFQWLQETVLSMPQAQEYISPTDREDAGVRLAKQNSYDDREERMQQLEQIATHVHYALGTAQLSPGERGVDKVAKIISIYFDETLWTSTEAEAFHEIMLTTTQSLSQGVTSMENVAAWWTAKVVSRTRPHGAYPGRDAEALKNLILGELVVMKQNSDGARTHERDSVKGQPGVPGNAVDVMWQLRKWRATTRAAALVRVNPAVETGGSDRKYSAYNSFSYFRNGEQAWSARGEVTSVEPMEDHGRRLHRSIFDNTW